jgi:KipI family sensor histidine kinase inhibitor
MNVLRAGDRAWLVELDDNAAARRLARHLQERGFEDVVPGHRTVLIVGDLDPAGLPDLGHESDESHEPEGALHEIPVAYDGSDIEEVAVLAGIDAAEVVARHCAPLYTVAFLGFVPGFPYLVGGDPDLEVPRRSDPRIRVPAGSVAIAGPYSGIYPRESPGGWRLIGRTDVEPFNAERTPPALLAPGDRVRFVAL